MKRNKFIVIIEDFNIPNRQNRHVHPKDGEDLNKIIN